MRHTGNAVILTDLDAPRIQFNSGYHDARFDVGRGTPRFLVPFGNPRSMTCNTSAKDSRRTTSTATASDWQAPKKHLQYRRLAALAGDLDRRRSRRHRDPSASMRDRGTCRLSTPRTGRRHDPRRPPSHRRSTRTLKRKGQPRPSH